MSKSQSLRPLDSRFSFPSSSSPSSQPLSASAAERFHDDSASSSEPISSPVHLSQPPSRQPSRDTSPFIALPHPDSWAAEDPSTSGDVEGRLHQQREEEEEGYGSGSDIWDDHDYHSDMPSDLRPPFNRPTDGKSQQPLLSSDKSHQDYASGQRPPMATRRSTFRERDPDLEAKKATRLRYTYAAGFLVLSLISFTIQTETAVYIQHTLKWNKAYCML